MRRPWFLILWSVVVLVGNAHGAILLNQPLAFIDGRSSHVANGAGFITYDRIQLSQTSEVDRVTWIGAFIDTTNVASNPVPLPATTWNFQVFDDALGTPGSATDGTAVSSANVVSTLLGSAALAGQPVNVYRFTAQLVDPLQITGGVAQWFTVFSENSNSDPRFAWFSGTLGDGVAKQQFLATQSYTDYVDRALTLEGRVVPEPATMPLLLTALGGLLLTRRLARRGSMVVGGSASHRSKSGSSLLLIAR